MLTGFLLLTAPVWASPEHVIDGLNYVLVLETPLVVNGVAMMLGGAVLAFAQRVKAWTRRVAVMHK